MTPAPDTAESNVYSPIAGNGAIATAPSSGDEDAPERVQADIPSFIETQFPVSRLSKESYFERKSHVGQTLTSLGKWWGRKPLVMVRAVILGLLMPASDDPRKDRDVFIALLTMDEEGLWRRKRRNIPLKEIHRQLTAQERAGWFALDTDAGRPKLKKGTTASEKARLQRLVFDRLGYDEKLGWCDRPEHLDGPSPEAWVVINEHLGTSASSLPELVRELGERRFGHVPRVGDAFCGGGSIPFEAARIGCEAYGSDLNPVAALLTWGALNIVGGGEEVAQEVRRAQGEVFNAVDQQITDWRIEHNDTGWRTDAFLYCTETKCPECGWQVPLAPSWVIGQKTRAVARLIPQPETKSFAIEILSGVDQDAMVAARTTGTVKQSRLECPNPACSGSTPMTAIRGDRRNYAGRGYGLRLWKNDDIVPRADDVFQERLYCVRWRLPQLNKLLWAEQQGLRSGSVADVRAKPRLHEYSKHSTELTEPAWLDDRPSGPAEAPAVPIPDWVELDDAINALAHQLDGNKQRELENLRARDWVVEDWELENALRELDSKRSEGSLKKELTTLKKRLSRLRNIIDQRNERVEVLTKALPTSIYRPVDGEDQDREARTLALLHERFEEWQDLGYIPSRTIVEGYNTNQVIRERGWTYWHHLFTPRQLLIHGCLAKAAATSTIPVTARVECLLSLGRAANWDSKLCQWGTGAARESISQTFYNQAFNTLFNFPTKGFRLLWGNCAIRHASTKCAGASKVATLDCRELTVGTDLWITDPPYADAINYHELSEFFLAWYENKLLDFFPDQYVDSKRALSVRGTGADFRRSMVDCYRNLTADMPDNGLQIVMFTHQDASVWADLTLILWAAGLRVTAAWTIATETESALKEGNYVQGTVLMVLRKQHSEETVFLDEVVPDVEVEVERQLKSMLELDDRDDPNFSDADYQLAAYAAALRVLTRYGSIEEIDIAYELGRERGAGEANPIEPIIEDAVRTASNFLVPSGLAEHLWRRLGPEEKLYLKGLEVESHGDYRAGVYQEFARGFGVRDYRFMLLTGKANETRLKTASEFQHRELGETIFGQSSVRHALYAVWRAAETGDVAGSLTWLRTELPDYWPQREALASVLRYLGSTEIDHWRDDAEAARIVAGAVENDHV